MINHNLKIQSIIAGAWLVLFATIHPASAADTNAPAIIPQPQQMELQSGVFTLTSAAGIHVDAASRATGNYLAAHLRPATGYPLALNGKWFFSAFGPGDIVLTTHNADTNLGAEGYELTVTTSNVVICAPAQAGLFYGVQTLLQLLPPEIFASNQVTTVAWQIP